MTAHRHIGEYRLYLYSDAFRASPNVLFSKYQKIGIKRFSRHLYLKVHLNKH